MAAMSMGTNYTGTPAFIGNTQAVNPVTGGGYYMPAGFTVPQAMPKQSDSVVNMLPQQRNTAGAYLPQNNIPLIPSNQIGVAVELKSDTNVDVLDKYWATLMAKFSGEDGQGLLQPYEKMVFYAVDEQGVGELGAPSTSARQYRLRIGPLADIATAQELCDKLLRFSDTSCNVVRMQ
jgi:hypothetical protein